MASFKNVEDAQIAEKRYVKKRFIYVESEEDVQILAERWFYDRSGTVEFISAGGCTKVVPKVAHDRTNQIEAYGIVDRDSLKRKQNWQIFFETDDDKFREAKPFGDYIHVLRYWEIENYLLHPEVIETFIADEARTSIRPLEKILQELFELACRLILVVAADIVLNAQGRASLSKAYGRNQQIEHIETTLRQHLNKAITEAADELFDEHIEKIVAFTEQTEPRSLAQWLALLRILDGKRLIDWIKQRYGIQHDPCGHLARLSKNKLNEILDPEIHELMK